MSQFDWGTMDPFVVDGVQLADLLNDWRDAVYTLHRGPARPTYVVPGMVWVDDAGGPTNWLIKLYISPALGDTSIFRVNTTTGLITLLGGAGSELIAETLIAMGANPNVRWLTPANPIDQKRVDAQLTAAGALRFRMMNDAGVETAWVQLNRDGSVTSSKIAGGIVIPYYLAGMIANQSTGAPTTTMSMTAGVACDINNTVMMGTAAAWTKTIGGAWVAGNGQAGLGVGVTAVGPKWLHLFTIQLPSGATDFYYDTSPLAANRPGGAVAWRRIRSIYVNASSTIVPDWDVDGHRVMWRTPANDVANANFAHGMDTNISVTVPTGVLTYVMMNVNGNCNVDGAQYNLYLWPRGGTRFPFTANQSPVLAGFRGGVGNAATASGYTEIMVDGVSGLSVIGAYVVNSVNSSIFTTLTTIGYIDDRGRYGL